MNIKIKNLLVSIAALAATFYAGMLVTRQQKSVSPIQNKVVSRPTTVVARINSIPLSQEISSNPYDLLPGSPSSKLSSDELKALIQDNPVAAAYARGVSGNKNFGYIVLAMARKWAGDDPQGALAWAQGLPAKNGRDDAIKLIFNLYGTKDPAGAAALAQTLPEEGKIRSLALDGLANNAVTISFQDPTQAAAMLNTLGRSETAITGDNPTAMVATSWIMRDPAAATQWIDTLPVGNTKDSAILAVVGVTGDTDPATAFSWLRTMSNAGKRGTTTSTLVAQWAQKDPAAAQAAVMQAYPNNRNGRQAALLTIIQQNAPNPQPNSQ